MKYVEKNDHGVRERLYTNGYHVAGVMENWGWGQFEQAVPYYTANGYKIYRLADGSPFMATKGTLKEGSDGKQESTKTC